MHLLKKTKITYGVIIASKNNTYGKKKNNNIVIDLDVLYKHLNL